MKKITLDLDVLQVDSFSTTPETYGRAGTVHGHEEESNQSTCCPTDALRTPCCWTSGTDAESSALGAGCGDGDSWYCGDDRDGPSHAPSCGSLCNITGIWKCVGDTTLDL